MGPRNTTAAPEFIHCSDINSYLAAAIDLASTPAPATAPVLDPHEAGRLGAVAIPPAGAAPLPSASLKRVAACKTQRARLELLSAAASARRSPGKVVVSLEDEAAAAGAVFACLTHRRLVIVDQLMGPTPDGTSFGGESVTLVASNGLLAQIGGDRLVQWVEALHAPRWGLLTAADLPELSRFVARLALRVPQPPGKALIYRNNSDRGPVLDDLDVVELPKHPAPELLDRRSLTAATPRGLVVWSGHGRSYCGMDGNLCSLAAPADADDDRCVDGLVCLYPGHGRLPARALAGDTVLLELCAAAALSSDDVRPADGGNIALQLAKGSASAVIAPYRNHQPQPFAPYLAMWHYRSGSSVGELLQDLNQLARQSVGVPSPYILLGDPEMRLSRGASETARSHGEARIRAIGGARLLVQARPGSVVRTDVPAPILEAAGLPEISLKRHPIREAAHQLLAPDDGAGYRLFVAVDRDLPAEEIEFDVAEAAIDGNDRSVIQSLRENLLLLSSFLPRSLAQNAEAPELEAFFATVGSLERHLTRAGSGPAMHEGVRASLLGLVHSALISGILAQAAVLKRLLREACGHVQWLHNAIEASRGLRLLGATLHPEPCPYCGKNLLTRRYAVGALPPVPREVIECENCLVISDIPSGAGIVTIGCPEPMPQAEAFTIGVRHLGGYGLPSIVHVGLAIDTGGGRFEPLVCEPAIRYARLEPGETLNASFRAVIPAGYPTQARYLHAVVLANGRLSSGTRRRLISRAPSAEAASSGSS